MYTLRSLLFRNLRVSSHSLAAKHCLFRKMSSSSKAANNVAVRSTAASGSQVYESKRAVDEYLLFHYGENKDMMPLDGVNVDFALNFSERCAKIGSDWVSKVDGKPLRVLDIGCAVGMN